MASTTQSKTSSNRAVMLKIMQRKFDALRYLPSLAHAFWKFNSSGDLHATTDLYVIGKVTEAPAATPGALATAGAGTITAALLNGTVMTRDCAGAGRADTTDTAANIIATLGLTANYMERFLLIHNISAGNFTSTLNGGTGVTLKGAITIEQNTAVKIAIVRTSGTTVAIRQV
jgi:hypothetical protein